MAAYNITYFLTFLIMIIIVILILKKLRIFKNSTKNITMEKYLRFRMKLFIIMILITIIGTLLLYYLN